MCSVQMFTEHLCDTFFMSPCSRRGHALYRSIPPVLDSCFLLVSQPHTKLPVVYFNIIGFSQGRCRIGWFTSMWTWFLELKGLS